MHGRYEHKKSAKKARPVTIILSILAFVLLIGSMLLILGYTYYNSMLNKINYVQMPPNTSSVNAEIPTTSPQASMYNATDNAEEPTNEISTSESRPEMIAEDIINVLVVGQASRVGEEAKMADTMILFSINTYTGTVTLTSILRDSFVKLPNYRGHICGTTKLTFCYNLGYNWGGGTAGAMEMTNICLNDNFGIEVDYNVEIDFDGFMALINQLGGVHLELTEAEAEYINDDLNGYCELDAGKNYLDGYMALSFARMRHAKGDNDSDIIRTERQRRLITALIERFRYKDISEIVAVADSALPLITTNMDPDSISKLLLQVLAILPDLKIESGTCPINTWGELIDIYHDGVLHSVLRFDAAENKKHMRTITEGELFE